MGPCSVSTRISLPVVLTFFLLFLCNVEAAADTLTSGQSIKVWETIVSADGVFELGFFNVSDSLILYYVGIWYHWGLQKRPLWVANREDPLTDGTGSLTIGNDGNLAILDRTNTTVWRTGLSLLSSSSTEAVLLNTGNLVLRGGNGNQSKQVLWQSFDYPSDTLFPGMKIGIDLKTHKSLTLVSWRGVEDPSPGIFSFGIDPQSLKDAFIWRNSKAIWRSLSWRGKPIMLDLSSPYFEVSSNTGELYISYSDKSSSPEKHGTSLVLTPYGQLLYIDETFNDSFTIRIWSRKEEMCNLRQNCFSIDDCGLDVCGVYSSCNDNDNPICECLPGFQPISEKEWDSGKWDAGCLPSTPSGCRNDDGFVQLKRMRVRNNPIFTSANSSDECKAYCLRDCACGMHVWPQQQKRLRRFLWGAEGCPGIGGGRVAPEELTDINSCGSSCPSCSCLTWFG